MRPAAGRRTRAGLTSGGTMAKNEQPKTGKAEARRERDLAKIDKQLAKAQDEVAHRARQQAKAQAAVRDLEAKRKGLSVAAPAEKTASGTSAATAPATAPAKAA